MATYSDDLVATVKRDAFLSTSQTSFSDADILAISDNCLRKYFIPMLMSLREGFYRVYEDIPFVDGQSDYLIPTYAMYGKLESVQYLNINGQILPGQLTRIEIENLQDILPTLGQGVPRFFTLNSSYITLYPTPQGVSGDAIRCYYDRRPGNLVVTSQASQIVGIDHTTGVVDYHTAPTNPLFTIESVQDGYLGSSPYPLLSQAEATNLVGTHQTFPPAEISTWAIGDWVCGLDQTVFIPLPEELMPYLSDMVILSLSRSQQDASLYKSQMNMISSEARQLLTSTGNRLPGNPKRIRLTNPLVRNRSIPRFR